VAIFHMSLKIVSRGKGKSAVAAAAYRAGTCITNEYDGLTHDYSHKRGIVHTEIMLPSHAPREYFDRSTLWNAVETVEKAKNSVLAREIEIALPVELSREQNIELVREYVRENFVDKGMCADVCIHDTGSGNPHAHVLCTVRPINENGTWGSKQRKEYIFDSNGNKIYDPKKETYKCRSVESTDWNNRDNAEIWRKSWAKSVNKYLEENSLAERVDHRSYERQGKEQIPTIHLGQEAYRMERRGIRAEFGDRNRKIHSLNSEIRQLTARIRKEKNYLYSQPLEGVPSMIDVANSQADWRNFLIYSQKLANLQAMASSFEFLRENNIRDFSELTEKAEQMFDESRQLAGDVKRIDKRLETLGSHIANYDIMQQYKAVALKLNSFKGKQYDAYVAKYKTEINAYRKAFDYFAGVVNGRTKIPIKAWRAEMKALGAERVVLGEKFYGLKDEIKVVENLRRSAEKLVREVVPILQKQKIMRRAKHFER